ncbi:hypothetical protein AAGC94_07845 [Clostridium sporogenes]|uniref:hypothetical protein n=1 Tax=Clostridium TaxID=1485 RepID=UPI001969E066|nr:hypothetical protein [Clostridium botulinum]MBN3348297.1 hypothetical protein [Clostridium botulinum]
MIEYLDINYFKTYSNELIRLIQEYKASSNKFIHIENRNMLVEKYNNILWRYLISKELPEIYLKENIYFEKKYPQYRNRKCKECGVQLVNINKICGHNCSDIRKKIYSTKSRVINSIPYLEMLYITKQYEECKPIDLSKIGEQYYIENGKHRFYAHILLKKDRIKAKVTEYYYKY